MGRRRFVIFTYHREARGFAARALRQALPRDAYEYRSAAALIHDGVARSEATPRYEGDATDAEMRRVLELLADDEAYGIDIYHD